VTSGPIQGQVFRFDQHDTFIFGRQTDCHACLPKDGYISRHHFLLEANPPDARVRDLGSLNGTIVNGVKYGGRAPQELPEDASGREYPVCDLADGDRITVGDTNIDVMVELPHVCGRCGAAISHVPEAGERREQDQTLCPHCRGVVDTVERRPSDMGVVCCDRCGRDVRREIGAGRGDAYVCTDCRDQLVDDGTLFQQFMVKSTPSNQSGPNIEGYQLEDELGKGAMGIVYRARNKVDGRVVAVKFMLAKVAVDAHGRELFHREIEVAQHLSHLHIVRLLEHGASGGAFYCVMEYCNQGSLQSVFDRIGRLSIQKAAPMMIQCVSGLAYAHKHGFVHRDLKPENVLLHKSGQTVHAKIADFGLAKCFQTAGLSGMTATGLVGGTLAFMPREQLTNFKYVHPASDVWSMAATFYWTLTGKCPLDFPRGRDPVEVILRDDPLPIRERDPDVPSPIAEVFDRALESDVSHRYQDASEFELALQHAFEKVRTK